MFLNFLTVGFLIKGLMVSDKDAIGELNGVANDVAF